MKPVPPGDFDFSGQTDGRTDGRTDGLTDTKKGVGDSGPMVPVLNIIVQNDLAHSMGREINFPMWEFWCHLHNFQ